MPIDPTNFDIEDARLDRGSPTTADREQPEDLGDRLESAAQILEGKLAGIRAAAHLEGTPNTLAREVQLMREELQELHQESREGDPAQSDAFRVRLSDLERRIAGLSSNFT